MTDDKSRKVPVNPEGDALAYLLSGLTGGNPSKTIEVQEAQGQRELVNSTQLPIEGSDHPAFEAWGIEFGPANSDGLFRDAKLPPGWKKQATDHSMWSDLVDNAGRKRASIFYKAAFYDRSAFMQPVKNWENIK